jgi:thioredoxin-related protein
MEEILKPLSTPELMKPNQLIPTLAFALASLTSAFAGGDGWLTDMDAAKAQAAKENKDLLLDFTGSDWCGWCIKLNQEVFSKEPFKTGTKDKFVLVELDFPKNKKLDPKLKEQNRALGEKLKVQGYPTIMLCDASGRPYAKTGYQPGGPEKYVEHLDKLQAVRIKRDEAFAAADKATDDAAKAKALVDGLKLIDEEIVDASYGDVIETISQLDKEDKTGFVKARQDAIAKKDAAEKTEGKVQEFFGKKIGPLMQAKEFDKALAEVKTFIKENPDLPEQMQIMMLMNVGLTGPMNQGDADAANAAVDEVAKSYPDSEFAKNIDKVKTSIKAQLDKMPKKDAPKEEK